MTTASNAPEASDTDDRGHDLHALDNELEALDALDEPALVKMAISTADATPLLMVLAYRLADVLGIEPRALLAS